MWRWHNLVLGEFEAQTSDEPGKPAGKPILGADPATPSDAAAASAVAPLAELIDETVLLFRRLRAVASELYGQGELSGGRRNLLRELEQAGPQTVPQMARARSVTRQHVQALVNPLAEQGYVEFVDNPAHKRSRLVRLTVAGGRYVAEMKRREAELLSQLETGVAARDTRAAAAVVRAVREAMTGQAWARLVEVDDGPRS
jgi:DNA-binding MarR family transcriptional regulator